MSAFARKSGSRERRRGLARAAVGRRGGSDVAHGESSEPRRDLAEPVSPGTLYVVATPIGNLEDITLRALRTLRDVAVVAAEDTRRSHQLLRHYDIATPLVSLHEHNERQRADQLISRLIRGESVALVSDAGTPGVSDPGALFVSAARRAGVRVEAIPGASAVAAILSASGLVFERYAFGGFPPIRSNDRKQWLNWVSLLSDVPVVCFEAPHRMERTLQELQSILVNRPIIVARELTKLHEQWWFPPGDQGQGDNAGDQAPVPGPTRGEFTFIITPESHPAAAQSLDTPSDQEIAAVFGQITETVAVGSRREAVRATADRLKLGVKHVYDALERVKHLA